MEKYKAHDQKMAPGGHLCRGVPGKAITRARSEKNYFCVTLQRPHCSCGYCLTRHQDGVSGSVGAISYKVVDSPASYSLKVPEELSKFAKTLVATMKVTANLKM